MIGTIKVRNGFLIVEFNDDVIKRITWRKDWEEEGDFPGRRLFERYFSGEKVDFSTLKLDFKDIPPFFARVYSLLRGVPWGKVVSYQDLALNLGNMNYQRAVGNAMSRNPFLIVVPCHRVIKKDGRIGSFGLGAEFKEWLLNLEDVRVNNGKISGVRYWWH
ncbi:MAG TPA: MGMT family protein [Dictyoglomaceae bacterium]|nr:MGMT family protein [Dictyoglomaceae bacterium]HOL40044.1 MGMT family protein [Dictyoglomaceae bacterium]HPP16543.1 MGMT family protein [Dictyoglomaceae bacterium]